MAVNLINSNDIEVEQTGQDIQLKTSTPISTLEGGISDNANNIQNIINGEKYLTTEVNTGKTWIDGKSIYRKVVTNNTTSTTGSWQYISLGDINIDNITFSQVIAKATDSEIYTDANYISTGYNWNYRFNKVNNTFGYLQNGYKNMSVVIIIEYTKTS